MFTHNFAREKKTFSIFPAETFITNRHDICWIARASLIIAKEFKVLLVLQT
jgi:hypothetical protein